MSSMLAFRLSVLYNKLKWIRIVMLYCRLAKVSKTIVIRAY